MTETLPREIGSKHFCIISTIPETDKIISAGEMEISEEGIFYNFESGTVMTIVERDLIKRFNEDLKVVRKAHKEKYIHLNREKFLIPFHNHVIGRIFPEKQISYTEEVLIDIPEIDREFIDKLCNEENTKRGVKKFGDLKSCEGDKKTFFKDAENYCEG